MNKKDLFLLLIQTGTILRILQDPRYWKTGVYAVAEIAELPEERLPEDPEQIARMAVEWVEYDLSTELTRPPLNRRGWHPQWRGGHSDRDKRKT